MKDREFERGQGCWNCIHATSAVKWWTERRQLELQAAARVSVESVLGEQDPKCRRVLELVNAADQYVAAGALIRCVKGVRADGSPVGDLTMHNYLCSKWSGREGSSLARIDGKLDKLPEELAWYVDGEAKPVSLTQAIRDRGDGDPT